MLVCGVILLSIILSFSQESGGMSVIYLEPRCYRCILCHLKRPSWPPASVLTSPLARWIVRDHGVSGHCRNSHHSVVLDQPSSKLERDGSEHHILDSEYAFKFVTKR